MYIVHVHCIYVNTVSGLQTFGFMLLALNIYIKIYACNPLKMLAAN